MRTHSEAEAATALERNFAVAFKALVSPLPDGHFHDGPELCWSLTRVPLPAFNAIFGAHLDAGNADQAIEAAKARARTNGVPLVWWIAPDNTPADLGERLSHAGFRCSATPPGMTLDLAGFDDSAGRPRDENFTIVTTTDEQEARAWHDTFAAGFSFPQHVADAFFPLALAAAADPSGSLSNYYLCADGQPVTTATLLIDDGVASIYNVATVPSARGRGFGSAISTHILREARRRGATLAVLQSSLAGVGMYRRLGFDVRFNFQQYVWRP